MATKHSRPRVSREEVRRKAAMGDGKRFRLSLPKGIEEWEPEKAGTVKLNFLPYEVKAKNHPDGVKPGALWYKFPFQVHRNIGVKNEMIICPASVGKPCPVCEEVKRLSKDYDDNADAIKEIKPKDWVAFVIEHPDDEDKVCVFAYSKFKFAEPLDEELADGKEENLYFYDCTDDGRTVEVRFSNDEYAGRKFLKAKRFDFKERAARDEDETIERSCCLDEIFDKVIPYDDLKKMFEQEDTGDDDKDEKEDKKASSKSDKKKDKEEDDEKDEPKFKVGDKVQAKDGDETFTGEITEIDDEDVTIEDDAGDEKIFDISDVTAAKGKKDKEKKKADAEDSVDEDAKPAFEPGDKVTWEDGDNSGVVVKVHSSGEKVKVKDDGDDEEKYVEIGDLVLAPKKSDKADKASSKKEDKKKDADDDKFKVGDRVKFEEKGEEVEGKITEIDDDDVTVEDDEDEEHVVDMDDIEKVEEDADEKEDKKAGKDKAASKSKFKVGDKVKTTVKGKTVKGSITEIDGDDITIEDADDEEYVVDAEDVESASKKV